ncbi:HAMP domain-containing histidine kinase [bacterium AH-315-K03]|nr:HAMP domain-containing histidine kinase [bacterium AH-315-K03]
MSKLGLLSDISTNSSQRVYSLSVLFKINVIVMLVGLSTLTVLCIQVIQKTEQSYKSLDVLYQQSQLLNRIKGSVLEINHLLFQSENRNQVERIVLNSKNISRDFLSYQLNIRDDTMHYSSEAVSEYRLIIKKILDTVDMLVGLIENKHYESFDIIRVEMLGSQVDVLLSLIEKNDGFLGSRSLYLANKITAIKKEAVGISVFLLILFAIIVVVLNVWISKAITKPLCYLLKKIESTPSIPRNKSCLDIEPINEMGIVSQAFASMLNQLSCKNDQLNDFENTLKHTRQVAKITKWNWHAGEATVVISKELKDLFTLNIQQGRVSIRQLLHYFDRTSRKNIISAVSDSISLYQSFSIQSTLVNDLGKHFCVDIRGAPKSGAQGEMLLVGSIQDISEQKKSDTAKSQFISTVSHELRTPLTAIRGSLGLALGDAFGHLGADIRSVLQLANNNTEKLLQLINDLLDVDQLESGKLRFSFKSCDLRSIVEDTVKASNSFSKKYNVFFSLTCKVPNAKIWGDVDRIVQALNHLLSNAAKFSKENSEILVSISSCERFFRVSVHDAGPGISESAREKIFEKFSQVDSSDSRLYGGVGIGLYIARTIIRQHKGFVDFENREQGGTHFYFDIPKYDTFVAESNLVA